MPPRVSIGLAVRNGGACLALTIQSLLAQEFGDFELLVSDNASTDTTADVCAEYARLDRRVRVFRHTRDIGGIRNFEHVFLQTSGELFMWSAHDDRRHPACLRRYVAALDDDPAAVLAMSDMAMIDACTGALSVHAFSPSVAADDILERLRAILYRGGGGVIYGLIRRNALARTRRVSAIPTFPAGIGLDYLAFELAMMGRFAYVPEPLIEYQINPPLPLSTLAEKFGLGAPERAVLWWLVHDAWRMSACYALPLATRIGFIREILSSGAGTQNGHLRRLNGSALRRAIKERNMPLLFSLACERAALTLRAPRRANRNAPVGFPAGLFQPGMQVSRFYQDGWIADVARLLLATEAAGVLRIKGLRPKVEGWHPTVTLEVSVDGRDVARKRLEPGDFDIEVAILPGSGPRWVELRVDAVDRLPPPDGRPASVLLKSIGLEPVRPPASVAQFPVGLFQPGLQFSGIYQDGWMADAARLRLAADWAGVLRIKGLRPQMDGWHRTMMLEVSVEGRAVARKRLEPGDFEIEAAITPASGPRWVELRADPVDRLPPPDGRPASVLLKSIMTLSS
jgi:hypothetical protein